MGFITAIKGGGWCRVFVIGEGQEYEILTLDLTVIDPMQTGKGYDKKICNLCHVLLDHSKFEPNQKDSKGNITTRPSCRKCRQDIINRQPITNKQRKTQQLARPRPGTLWRCPICRKRSIVNVTAKIVMDHDHSSGKVRGFLCDSCNTGLGRFRNGTNYLQNAIAYLIEFDDVRK